MLQNLFFRHYYSIMSGPVYQILKKKKGFILFHPLACGDLLWKSNQTGDNYVEVGISQPTMSSQRMVVGNILAGTLQGFHIIRNLKNCMLQNWISLMRQLILLSLMPLQH